MPKVPNHFHARSPMRVPAPPAQQAPPAYLMMAAAHMDSMGRLFPNEAPSAQQLTQALNNGATQTSND